MTPVTGTDEADIYALIQAQFASLSWSPTQAADWVTFEAGFLPTAQLLPAKRPVQVTSVADFRARMERLRLDGSLTTFDEKAGPMRIWVMGRVAVAIAGCEMVENCQNITRDISAFLLVKDADTWKIAAQGWDIVANFEAITSWAQ